MLRTALAASPTDAGLHYALGLALIRQKRREDALFELRQAAKLAPQSAHYVFVYAMALDSTGRSEQAQQVLTHAFDAHQGNLEILGALVQMSLKTGDQASALPYAEQMLRVMPEDQNIRGFVEELRRAAKP